MPYAFLPDESVDAGLQRLVDEQIRRTLKEVRQSPKKKKKRIHSRVLDARKRLKKVRAAIRLARGALGEEVYRRENTWYRDIAHEMANIREARAMMETIEAVEKEFRGQVEPGVFERARQGLREQLNRIVEDEEDPAQVLASVVEGLEEGRARIGTWEIHGTGFDALSEGFRKTFKKARKHSRKAREKDDSEHFHDCRKFAKYHRYHCRMLRHLWPEYINPYRKYLRELSDLLGLDHDLETMRTRLDRDPESFGREEDVLTLRNLLDQRSTRLRARSLAIAGRAFAEKPRAITGRFETYWNLWEFENSDPR